MFGFGFYDLGIDEFGGWIGDLWKFVIICDDDCYVMVVV